MLEPMAVPQVLKSQLGTSPGVRYRRPYVCEAQLVVEEDARTCDDWILNDSDISCVYSALALFSNIVQKRKVQAPGQ
jgi:hypothetical protein